MKDLQRRDFIKASVATIGAFAILPSAKSAATGRTLPSLLGDSGSATISPAVAWRDKVQDYTITIKLGKGGLPAGDSLGLVNGSMLDRWKFEFPSHYWGQQAPWQIEDSAKPNFISATSSRPGVKLTLENGTRGPARPFCNRPDNFSQSLKARMRYTLELTPDKPLQEGDRVTISWQKVKAPPYAMKYFFLPFRFGLLPKLDRDMLIGQGEYTQLPTVHVKGHTAEYFHVVCRPMQGVGEKFAIKIAAIDTYGNLAQDFCGEIKLESPALSLPKTITLTEADHGCKKIQGLSCAKPGWYRIKASSGKTSGISNYIVVSQEKPKHRLYFGDMHSHTLDCDGTNDISEHFFYAPNVAGLDFGAVSCHAEYFEGPEAWQRYLRETTKANRPGEFVTFYGYEWAQQGHTNAYFLKEEETILIWGERRMKPKGYKDAVKFRVGAANEKEYMQILGRQKGQCFTIAHVHSAYRGLNDKVNWLDEVYSCHKHDRKKRENRLRGNLAKGMYLGVVAGSDQHRLCLGHLTKDPGKRWPQGGWERCQYQTAGLQATFATELTRNGLHLGMKERHTYGTTGARIVALFDCNGSPMGSRLKLEGKPVFNIEVGGTGELTEIALCHYDGKSWSEPFVKTVSGSDRFTGKWTDGNAPTNGIYYIRVTQKDGDQAWTSPVWVSS